jgi:protein-L-isoaspartate(D-aspartate) O-methyltransferase
LRGGENAAAVRDGLPALGLLRGVDRALLVHVGMRWVLLCFVAAELACRQPASSPKSNDGASLAVESASVPAAPMAGDSEEARALRRRMLDSVREEVKDTRVLDAMDRVPRHLFVPGVSLRRAYDDRPAPIGYGQTISQPTIVGVMTEALELTGRERVLEIGTGSGYQAAILSLLAREVYTIEIVPQLAEQSRERLAGLGYANVHVLAGDGYKGWPEYAPFDRVVVTAAPEVVPQALFDQLAEGGILVAPVGPTEAVQELMRYRKLHGRLSKQDLGPVRFVPMVPGD